MEDDFGPGEVLAEGLSAGKAVRRRRCRRGRGKRVTVSVSSDRRKKRCRIDTTLGIGVLPTGIRRHGAICLNRRRCTARISLGWPGGAGFGFVGFGGGFFEREQFFDVFDAVGVGLAALGDELGRAGGVGRGGQEERALLRTTSGLLRVLSFFTISSTARATCHCFHFRRSSMGRSATSGCESGIFQCFEHFVLRHVVGPVFPEEPNDANAGVAGGEVFGVVFEELGEVFPAVFLVEHDVAADEAVEATGVLAVGVVDDGAEGLGVFVHCRCDRP